MSRKQSPVKARSEYQEQKEFVEWLRIAHPRHAKAIRLSLNGIRLGGVQGNIQISKAKACGMIVGEADMLIAYPSGKYCGIVLEFKKVGGVVSKEQFQYLLEMAQIGHFTAVPFSAKEAIGAFESYIRNPDGAVPYV